MFSTEELQSLDRKYFNVIVANDYDVTVMSRNTGHYWYLHNPEYPERGMIILFHLIRTLWLYELSALEPLKYKDSGN